MSHRLFPKTLTQCQHDEKNKGKVDLVFFQGGKVFIDFLRSFKANFLII